MFVLISGTSCSGKTSVAELLVKKCLNKIVTTTTRLIRKGESAQAYEFVSQDAFENDVDKNKFLEFNQHGDHLYGVRLANLSKYIGSNQDAVLVIEPNGFKKVKKYLEANDEPFVSVFLDAPIQDRIKRLMLREKNTEAATERLAVMFDVESAWRKEIGMYDMLLESDISSAADIVEIIMRHVNARNSLSKRKAS